MALAWLLLGNVLSMLDRRWCRFQDGVAGSTVLHWVSGLSGVGKEMIRAVEE